MNMTQQRIQDTTLGTPEFMSQYSDVKLPTQTH